MPLDKPKAPFSLPKLPYEENALEPVVSAKTISFHYGKHHKAYVDNLNRLVVGTPYEQMDLEEIVKKSAGNDKDKGIFNNAGQIWNHNFYWESMAPKGGAPAGKIADALKSSFGGVAEFNDAFAKAAVAHMTKCMAVEWGRFGINVNAFAPTFIETDGTAPALANTGFRADVVERIAALHRIGMPDEVSGAVVFLASPAASLITGQTLLIDGGWTAR